MCSPKPDTLFATITFALSLLLVSPLSWAGSATFETGTRLFKEGRYSEAIDAFQQARAEGDESLLLHYNLAVSYYRLGRYRMARRHFLKLLDHRRLGPLARYNLGLVAYRLDGDKIAANWFQSSYEQSEDPDLKSLAARQLDKLRSQAPKPSSWSSYTSASYGLEDNVTQVNDELTQVSSESDSYWDLYTSINYQYSGDRKQGTLIRLGGGLTRYNRLNQYDQDGINLGIYQNEPLAGWQMRYGAHYYYDRIDRSGYQQRFKLQARGTYHIGADKRFRLQYDVSRLNELDTAYAYLGGWRQRLRAGYLQRNGDLRLRLRYTLELNDREDFSTPTTFISYSPTRHTFLASVRSPLTESWSARADLEYRDSDYNQTNISAGAPTAVQRDQRLRLSFYATYRYNRNIDLEVRYRYTDNQSNLVDQRYQNNLLTFSVNAFF